MSPLPAFDFANAGAADELQRFFVLLWAELFGHDTADTWQVRTMNTRTALAEVQELVTVARLHPKSLRDLDHIVAEVDHLAKSDEVIAAHFPFFTAYLGGITALRPAKDGSVDIEQLAVRINVLASQLDLYCEKAIEELRKLLLLPATTDEETKEKNKQKDRLIRLANTVATEISSMGYSNPFLRSSVEILLSVEPDFGKRFDALMATCSGKRSRYECTFDVRWPGEPKDAFEKAIIVTRANNVRRATVRIEALDPWDAHEDALRLVARACSTFSFFEPRKDYGPLGRHASVRGEAGTAVEVSRDDSHESYIQNAGGAGDFSARLLDLQGQLEASEREQLSAALDYHRLATVASSEEARLVNLWIALECLVTRGRGSIIQAVCDLIPPMVALRNIRKHVRNLAKYVVHHLREKGIPLKDVFPSAKTTRLEPRVLIESLRDGVEGKGPLLDKLYETCGDHLLLRHRIYRLEKKILEGPERVAENLKLHRQNVEWQLRRIYRARNAIVHRGGVSPHTRRLLQHLHTYVNSTFWSVIKTLEARSRWTLGHVFEHRRALFDFYVATLKSPTATAEMTLDSLVEPETVLNRATGGGLAWKPVPKSGGVEKKAR